MFRSVCAILLAVGLVLFANGQSDKPKAQTEPSPAATPGKVHENKGAPKSESLYTWLLRVTGISATSRGLKGDHPPLLSGELWIVDVSTLVRIRVGTGSRCRTPVFDADDKSILALCQGRLTQFSLESMDFHDLGKAPT